jgi:hypothetical protein
MSDLDSYAIFSPEDEIKYYTYEPYDCAPVKNGYETTIAQDVDSNYYLSSANMQHNRYKRIAHTLFEIRLQDDSQMQSRIERNRHCVHIHRNMMRVKVESAMQQLSDGLTKRGDVQSFSRKSRKRMIDLMNMQKHGAPQTFVSLTYADEALFERNEHGHVKRISGPADWKNDLEILRKRIEKLLPDVKAIWRIELQNRKSGNYKDYIAPHYHLLVWYVEPSTVVQIIEKADENGEIIEEKVTFSQWLSKNWYEILGTGLVKALKNGVHVSAVKSNRHAMFYVSKYVAKRDGEFAELYEVGRRWGRIGQFDTSATIIINMSEHECNQFKRLLRAYLKSVDNKYYKRIAKSRSDRGFTLYGYGDNHFDLWQSDKLPVILQLIKHAQNIDQNQYT